MNKQAKLYGQGMHPVIRIGDDGKWERMKASPTYFVGHCVFQRVPKLIIKIVFRWIRTTLHYPFCTNHMVRSM